MRNVQVRRPGTFLAIALALGMVCLFLPATSAGAETGSISGKVTNNSAQPLEDICVDVHHSNGGLIEEEFTGPDGKYTVNQLENRNYKVEFYDCGDNNVAGEFYNNKSTFNAATPVTVAGGSATTSINAVLGPAGSISGKVTDSSAQPLVDICVDVYDLEEDLVDVSYTEDDGTYLVEGLSSGSHKVEFTDCGDHNVAGEFYNNKSTFESANQVPVSAGSNTPGINASLDSGGSISGTVTDTSGDPLEEICVDAYDSTGEDSGFGYSEPDGSYSVEGLTSGNHRLEFSDCGENNVAAEFYDNKTQLASANPVSVIAGAEVTGINATLASGGSISGKVTDSNSKPLEDICVDAYDSNGVPNGSGYTEADGTYLIEALAGGNHRVKFYDCGSNKVANEFYKNKSNLSEATRIAVTAGSTTGGINASLAPQGGGGGNGGGGNGGGGNGGGGNGGGSNGGLGGNGGGSNGGSGGNLSSIKAKVIGPKVLKKGRRKAYKVKIGISGSVVAKGLKLKVTGRGVRSKRSVGKIPPGRIKKVKIKLKPKKAGKAKLAFKITSQNAGRKVIRKKVTVKG